MSDERKRLERTDIGLRLIATHIRDFEAGHTSIQVPEGTEINDVVVGLLGVACGFADTLAGILDSPVEDFLDLAIMINGTKMLEAEDGD